MYNYYHIKTDCCSDIWNTSVIENYLRSFRIFEEGNGTFFCQKPFLDISLMKVKNLNSWSSLDYNKSETNYISIITSCFSDDDNLVKNILHGLEQLSGFGICIDE